AAPGWNASAIMVFDLSRGEASCDQHRADPERCWTGGRWGRRTHGATLGCICSFVRRCREEKGFRLRLPGWRLQSAVPQSWPWLSTSPGNLSMNPRHRRVIRQTIRPATFLYALLLIGCGSRGSVPVADTPDVAPAEKPLGAATEQRLADLTKHP